MAALSKTDLMYEIADNPNFVLSRSLKASVKTVIDGKEVHNWLRNHSTEQYYDLDDVSMRVWGLIDGKHIVDQIVQEANISGEVNDPDAVTSALLFFAEAGMLMSEEDTAKKRRVRIVSSFETQVTLIWNATRIFASVHRFVRPLLRASLFWLSMAIVAIGLMLYVPRFGSIFGDARNFQILGSTVVGFLFYNYVVLAPVIAIHELCHGLALVHYSGGAGEVGTGLFYFGPMFYVDVTGYWSLPRRQRVMIMWAGNLSTLLIGAFLVLTRLSFQFPVALARILDIAAFWCFYITLWNLAPPFETDGYRILADLVNIPNLRADGFDYLKAVILRIFHRPALEPEGLTDRKRKILLVYAVFSIATLTFIVIQTLRFTLYMASDASSWGERIWTNSLSGGAFTPLTYAVGLTSIAYFGLTLSGYGVVVGNQFRRSLVRGLRFEAVHDRHLSVFFYLPSHFRPSTTRKLEKKLRSVTNRITPSISINHDGPLFAVTLNMGSATLPFSRFKLHLEKFERRFYQPYQALLFRRGREMRNLIKIPGTHESLSDLLRDMAEKTPLGERSEVKGALKEFFIRQEERTQYLLSSTFATVWTIEVSPSQQYQLLRSMLPGLLVEDLVMTDLAKGVEEFKRQVIYGLDSIAQLAERGAEEREEALAHPERFQLLTFFEPVRGRMIFIGRTQRIERKFKSLGPLFNIQVWSGHLDNLFADISLSLFSIAQSLPALSIDLGALRDSEVKALDRYVSSLAQLESTVLSTLTESKETLRWCNTKLRDLKRMFEPEKGTRIGLFDSVLELNGENLQSIPQGLKEVRSQSKEIFAWVKTLKEPLNEERRKRETAYLGRKKRIARQYAVIGPLSAGLIVLGLLQLGGLLAPLLFATGATSQLAFVGAYYLLRRANQSTPRYPTETFTQILTVIYALTQTLGNMVMGAMVLNPREIQGEIQKEGGNSDSFQAPSKESHQIRS